MAKQEGVRGTISCAGKVLVLAAGVEVHGKARGGEGNDEGQLDKLCAYHPQLCCQVPHLRAAQQVGLAVLVLGGNFQEM
jgi:hypothetical protein